MPSFEQFMEAKTRIKNALATQVQENTSPADLRRHFDRLVGNDPVYFTDSERDNLFNVMLTELLGVSGQELEGYGPLMNLLDDPDITDILINNYHTIFVERAGKLERSAHVFANNDHLLAVLQRVAADFGQKLDESHPIVDLRFPDGSLGYFVIPPIAQSGPAAVLRKARQVYLTLQEMAENGSLSADAAAYLADVVMQRRNLAVTGNANSGKTTLLAALGRAMSDDERIFVIQEADVPLRKPHLVVLEDRPANLEGRGEVSMAQLLESAGRMRPERVLVDSIRSGAELAKLVQLVQAGHHGVIFSMRAASVRDLVAQMEVLLGEFNPTAPVLAHREAIAAVMQVVVTMIRGTDGVCRVGAISEVDGMEGSLLSVRDVFRLEDGGLRRTD